MPARVNTYVPQLTPPQVRDIVYNLNCTNRMKGEGTDIQRTKASQRLLSLCREYNH